MCVRIAERFNRGSLAGVVRLVSVPGGGLFPMVFDYRVSFVGFEVKRGIFSSSVVFRVPLGPGSVRRSVSMVDGRVVHAEFLRSYGTVDLYFADSGVLAVGYGGRRFTCIPRVFRADVRDGFLYDGAVLFFHGGGLKGVIPTPWSTFIISSSRYLMLFLRGDEGVLYPLGYALPRRTVFKLDGSGVFSRFYMMYQARKRLAKHLLRRLGGELLGWIGGSVRYEKGVLSSGLRVEMDGTLFKVRVKEVKGRLYSGRGEEPIERRRGRKPEVDVLLFMEKVAGENPLYTGRFRWRLIISSPL
ncbi:MAG: hypothetical protein DRO11_09515 [Methanobacteriota archaeon]|nr:MAG: hypothetical protein DRO11_09515 [Euryarchaeota archaeon]